LISSKSFVQAANNNALNINTLILYIFFIMFYFFIKMT
jgi:hypothetical protein